VTITCIVWTDDDTRQILPGSPEVTINRVPPSPRADEAPRQARRVLVGELRTALRGATFVSVMKTADLGNGGDSSDS
jgi:hypothetical protein